MQAFNYANTLSLIFALFFIFMGQAQASPLAAREVREVDNLFARDGHPITINNKCEYDVYIKHIYGSKDSDIQKLEKGKKLKIDSPESIESAVIKASKKDDISEPAQFEWSVTDKLYYDISLIDGNPFLNDKGESFIPKKGKNCNKKKLSCKDGETNCADAYYIPDDRQTWTCDSFKSFEINLCKN